jgi:hypothetical protein
MAAANPLWSAPRIHGELLKLRITVAELAVSRLMLKSSASGRFATLAADAPRVFPNRRLLDPSEGRGEGRASS